MFLDEARLAARIRHPNVISPLDVVATKGELFLVMDYVQGESLSKLRRGARGSGKGCPPHIARAIISGVLHGLHDAHEARSEQGEPLGIVHRDVSPQNVLVGVDGVARVLDFGIAKAAGSASNTREGTIKGKIAYMAPERFRNTTVNRQSDVYSAAVVLWETLTGQRLFKADDDASTIVRVLSAEVVAPSELASGISPQLDAAVLRGLERDPAMRYKTAREMARALEACGPLATATEVGDWVRETAHEALSQRAGCIAEIEQLSDPAFLGLSSQPPTTSLPAPAAPTSDDSTGASWNDGVRTRAESPRWAPSRLLRSRGAVAASLALLLLLAAGGAVVAGRSPAGGAAAGPRPVASAPIPPDRASEPVRAASAMEATSAAALVGAPPDDPASSAVAPKSPSTARSTKPVPAPVRPRARADCDPPYTLDAVGHRHYKVECL